jgi:hypothetical protein
MRGFSCHPLPQRQVAKPKADRNSQVVTSNTASEKLTIITKKNIATIDNKKFSIRILCNCNKIVTKQFYTDKKA